MFLVRVHHLIFREKGDADDYFLQKLLQTELIITPPEELASRLKEYF